MDAFKDVGRGAEREDWESKKKLLPIRTPRDIGVWRGVSKGVEDGSTLPALWAGHP
jgi:hypothetical protein